MSIVYISPDPEDPPFEVTNGFISNEITFVILVLVSRELRNAFTAPYVPAIVASSSKFSRRFRNGSFFPVMSVGGLIFNDWSVT